MLNFDRLHFRTSDNMKVAPGAVIAAEGQALVAEYVGGELHVKPSTGAATERFVGLAIAETMTQAYLPFVEEHAVSNSASATDTVTLSKTPVAGSLLVQTVAADGAVATLTAGTPGGSAATTYSISGATVTFWAPTLDGKSLRVTARYAPTVLQLRELQGDQAPGSTASATLNVVGALEQGDFETSEFDTTQVWDANADVKLGANGRFTQTGSGKVVDCLVTRVPSVDNPFLGLKLK
ncbi:hypothetical protein GR7B_00130 [Vibrio phage vB_VcorM_GR7B]|nr:hypothetical protein GR7B_00130 [Vibrio phage vB_VcorM_GR7B]